MERPGRTRLTRSLTENPIAGIVSKQGKCVTSSAAIVTPIPSYLVTPRQFASRLTIVLLVLITGWVELGHVGGYQVHWSRLLSVFLALLAWWWAWPAAFRLL